MTRVRNEPEGPVARANASTDPLAGLPLASAEPTRIARRSRTQDRAAHTGTLHRPGIGARILEHLRTCWPHGQTREQIAAALEVKVNTVNARVAELRSPVVFHNDRVRLILSRIADDPTLFIAPPLYEDGERDGCALVRAYHSHPLTIQECIRVTTSNVPR